MGTNLVSEFRTTILAAQRSGISCDEALVAGEKKVPVVPYSTTGTTSGSVVATMDGSVVGMVFAGSMAHDKITLCARSLWRRLCAM
jgi:hypothetical protein